jgi:hypothetical protein
MINNVNSSSKHMYAAGGSSLPYVSMNHNNPSQGMLRLNGSDMEVFDGNSWMKIYAGSANVGLNNEAEKAIDWAIKRMKQEEEWYKLATTNKAVRIALDQLEQAKTRLELTSILARENEETTTS